MSTFASAEARNFEKMQLSERTSLLNEHFMYLLDMNGYAVVGHLYLLTQPIKSGANSEARSLHKKRFVRFSEPNPESGEAIFG